MSLPLVVNSDALNDALRGHFDTQADHSGTETPQQVHIVDVRPENAYIDAHIDGAVRVDPGLLNRAAPPSAGMLPDLATANAIIRGIGVNPGDWVVAYDTGGETSAARFIWVMHAYGFDNVSYLDGGLRAWHASGYGLDNGEDEGPDSPGTLELSLRGDNVVDAEKLAQELEDPTLRVLDVRSAAEYAGTDVRSARGGHVPGARHLEWTRHLDANGALLNDAALASDFSQAGVDKKDDKIIVYCQSHQRSAVTYVALKHLGYDNVRAIDGAWSSWGNRDDVPVSQV